jgi:hypothetical protein
MYQCAKTYETQFFEIDMTKSSTVRKCIMDYGATCMCCFTLTKCGLGLVSAYVVCTVYER